MHTSISTSLTRNDLLMAAPPGVVFVNKEETSYRRLQTELHGAE